MEKDIVKNVIVSIDPLQEPENIVKYATELARAGQRHLILYGVQGPPVMADPATSFPPTHAWNANLPGRFELAEKTARKLFEQVQQQYANVSFEYGVGFMAPSIVHRLEQLTEEDPSQTNCLLVMAKTHGQNWWNELVGTTETTVAADSPCPVLFLPEDVKYHGIKRVMYLADEESLKNHEYPGFRFLRSFAKNFGANIVIGYLGDREDLQEDGTQTGAFMKNEIERLPLQFSQEFRFFEQQSAAEILDLAELTGTDVIAFPYRDSSFFGRIFENEITQDLLLKTTIPAMVF